MENQDIFRKDKTYVAHTYNRFPAAFRCGVRSFLLGAAALAALSFLLARRASIRREA